MEILIVSKRPEEVEFIRNQTGLPKNTRVIADPKPEDVEGNIVYGNMPFELAALTHMIIMVQYDCKLEDDFNYSVDGLVFLGARLKAFKVISFEAAPLCSY